MVDTRSRTIIRTALKLAAQGRISSSECENRFLELHSPDGIVDALYQTIRYINPAVVSTQPCPVRSGLR